MFLKKINSGNFVPYTRRIKENIVKECHFYTQYTSYIFFIYWLEVSLYNIFFKARLIKVIRIPKQATLAKNLPTIYRAKSPL